MNNFGATIRTRTRMRRKRRRIKWRRSFDFLS
jgi:hypothetical protein